MSQRTGHLAISIGLGDVLLNGVNEGSLQANPGAIRQWRFRVARLRGETNPYGHLVPTELLEQTLACIEKSKTSGLPICVQLNGGIGDHIEALSLLLPWAKAQDYCLKLEMGAERQKQIEPLLPQWNQRRCRKNPHQNQAISPIPVMAKGRCDGAGTPAQCPSWEEFFKPTSVHWLCCWRAEGAGDGCLHTAVRYRTLVEDSIDTCSI